MPSHVFRDLLPQSLSIDGGIRTIADSLEPHLKGSDASIASILLMARLFSEQRPLAPALERLVQESGDLRDLEESLLDHLAWQLHVDDYDLAKTYEAKLDMVRSSIAIHRKKGTPWAVRRAIEAAFQGVDATVLEWFDYGAPAYHFKVSIDVSGEGIMEDGIVRAQRLIESNKSKRSLCDGVTIALTTRGDVYVGAAVFLGNSITIEPELNDYLEISTGLNFSLGVHLDGSMTIPAAPLD